jgi:predicted ATPase with chaperone activity
MLAPATVEEMGVPRKLLEDLALKTLFVAGELTLVQLAEHMRVSRPVVRELFERLRREALCQVTGMVDGVHQIVTTAEGRARALELLALSQYTGPTPVSLRDYVSRVRTQTVTDTSVTPADVGRAFEHLVLDHATLAQIGTAVVSGRAIFLYGPTGTGKTTVAESIWNVLHQDAIWVPHAVEIDGQVVTVYDPGVHHAIDRPLAPESDRRWVLCQRPRVFVGGELTIEMLDLQLHPVSRYYAAPVQMKANNGVLIIDDFGRQRVRPDELLNRWVVPLDRRIDFLTLAGGRKVEVPFDVMVVFATNLDPSALVDEAFLRRIQSKIKLDTIRADQFHEICRRVCAETRLPYDGAVVDHLIDVITGELRQPLRPCHPRDIARQVLWAARYEQREPRFDRESVSRACRSYFLSPDEVGAPDDLSFR